MVDTLSAETALQPLLAWLQAHPRLLVLTGAGCSTGVGIPDYRDRQGAWKRPPPVQYADFMGHSATRQRYWARSLLGWPMMAAARPGPAHRALVELEARGHIQLLVTQNVDGLHAAAGSRACLDLHGRLDSVRCMACAATWPRSLMQQSLLAANPGWDTLTAEAAPDGDADLAGLDFSRFVVPGCPSCAGLLKPDVVFYGESVPLPRVEQVRQALSQSQGLLVLGSSLMVYSGYRWVLAAVAAGLPVAAINQGLTRADDLLSLKVDADVGAALDYLLQGLGAR